MDGVCPPIRSRRRGEERDGKRVAAGDRHGVGRRHHGAKGEREMKLAAFVIALAIALDSRAATTATIPHLLEMPTIDGVVNSREWNAASILPPLIEQASNGVRGGQHTRIYLGWRDANLVIAIQHHKPRSATMVESSAT